MRVDIVEKTVRLVFGNRRHSVCRAKCARVGAALVLALFVSSPGVAIGDESECKRNNSGPETVANEVAEADSVTQGVVTVDGRAIAYNATAGIITVGSDDGQDALLTPGQRPSSGGDCKPASGPRARMFYVAYFKKDGGKNRPITFLYNGGPGSSTAFLHMFAFGPRRVSLAGPDAGVPTVAPYRVINNDFSLLDQSDLVFIDAPGTGFGVIEGNGKEHAFWGNDADVHAFERFIRRFLTHYGRWNSPKYLVGESYGTLRNAQLAAALQNVSLSGIVMVSQLLSFSDFAEAPQYNPGTDQAYALALPSLAAVAFYHHKLPSQPASLESLLAQVEQYALGDYMSALLQGSELPAARREAVAQKLHDYTGLPVALLLRADLRIRSGVFSKNLLADSGQTLGTYDGRVLGSDLDPLASNADDYDPVLSTLMPAAAAATNDYLRTQLKYVAERSYRMSASDAYLAWNWHHEQPGGSGAEALGEGTNVMPDLAYAMKLNPRMQVMLTGGYFDLAAPFFSGKFEMHHLQIPQSLRANIIYHYYPAGHMFYLSEEALRQFHTDVAALIATSSGRGE